MRRFHRLRIDCWAYAVLACAVGLLAVAEARAQEVVEKPPGAPFLTSRPFESLEEPSIGSEPLLGDSPEALPPEMDCYEEGWSTAGPAPMPGWSLGLLGSRHSKTHGRAIGPGEPLRGTSWLNRPYEVAFEFGALVMTSQPASGVRSGNDLFAAIHAGWDWDHYWGGQMRVGWATPTLDNTSVEADDANDNFFLTDVSVLYYPWGDSKARPFFRLGLGLTDLEYTDGASRRERQQLFTIPIAIGFKYQFRRWLVWRTEFANNLAIGQNGANTMDNITLTFGMEGRFGGRPTGYWAWHPRGHAW